MPFLTFDTKLIRFLQTSSVSTVKKYQILVYFTIDHSRESSVTKECVLMRIRDKYDVILFKAVVFHVKYYVHITFVFILGIT